MNSASRQEEASIKRWPYDLSFYSGDCKCLQVLSFSILKKHNPVVGLPSASRPSSSTAASCTT